MCVERRSCPSMLARTMGMFSSYFIKNIVYISLKTKSLFSDFFYEFYSVFDISGFFLFYEEYCVYFLED